MSNMLFQDEPMTLASLDRSTEIDRRVSVDKEGTT